MKRVQEQLILQDLQKKMVFLVGPRQAGKTWLAKHIGTQGSFSMVTYLNVDNIDHRRVIQRIEWPQQTDLLILDELHKLKGWKNFLKGVYDTKPEQLHILVTGSARLNTFRQTGDSMAGRFFVHRLLPFSLAELRGTPYANDIDALIQRGGFPEPLLAQTDEEAQRWRKQYTDGLIREDVLDFERVNDIQTMQIIFDLLRRSVGSSVSYSSIARDVQASPATVKRYIDILEALYIIFRVTPYSKNIARSILKEPKIYFYDTGLVEGDNGARFENMVALSLLKYVCGKTDYTGKLHALHYLRTKQGQEVDFCIVRNGEPQLFLETKWKEKNLSRSLHYFHKKYGVPSIQLVKELAQERSVGGIDIRNATSYLSGLEY
ncbi:MAG: ATP-binding protein [Candidatus Kerfeldbacteria bacterium]|nr:ATP-binding protein [Candidatus Kerfeldbacteria bacterium]